MPARVVFPESLILTGTLHLEEGLLCLRVPFVLGVLQVVYDHGPVDKRWPTFDKMRERVQKTWHSLPPTADPLSKELHDKIMQTTKSLRTANEGSVSEGSAP